MTQRNEWFAIQALGRGVHLVGEPGHVNSFLVEGNERAALFDTGMGIADIQAAVADLNDKPILVVNSHYHFDHVGGNHLFDDIAIHEAGVKPLGEPVPPEWHAAYVEYANALLEKFKVFKELDDAAFRIMSPDTWMRPLPGAFDPKTWTTIPTVPTRVLQDGDEINLGDRVLRVLHTPGHTPDCICLLDDRNRILFGGDTIDTGPIYAQLPDSDVEAFARSTKRLAAEVTNAVDIIYAAHGARYWAYAEMLPRVADAFAATAEHRVEWADGVDIFGDKVREADFRGFSIVVPPDYDT
jgi:glyoxylase-like metal-dependent hydrolase (beta-lactamase superfamily II)